MLSISNLSFYFADRPLYENASLHIRPGDKIGLIGQNGTGKSTLLKLIVGQYTPDSGSISKSNECTIGFLNQDLLSYESGDSILLVAMQAFEEQNKIQAQINEVLEKMEEEYSDDLVDKLAELQDRFEVLGGYTMEAKAEEILEGLGFATKDLQRPLKEFSGGWRMRVMLAKILLAKPSLLLLDEPTNHLDLPSIQWIENYLTRYEGAVVIVSHDRMFLDNCVNMIVEVTGQKLIPYAGNYTFYLEEKQLRNEIQKGAFENQQTKIRQQERFIERFKAKASKATLVQSRVKALNRMELIDDVVDENAKISVRFTFKVNPGRTIVKLDGVHKAYGDLQILKNAFATIERGDKIALIGANGKGKSTMLRIIAGAEEANQGDREEGHNVVQSFFAQHQLEALNLNNSILDEMKQAGSARNEVELRTVLGCFLFSNDEVFKKIKVLSGGEKSRVALAKTLISDANFLLLDEPTNHLDMQSVNILIQAMQQYEGTFVTVSHDRHFVSNIANKIWYIEDQELKEYPGTYDEYEFWRENIRKEAALGKQTQTPPKPVQPKPAPVAQKPVNNNDPLRKQLTELENSIAKLEQDKDQLEVELSDPTIYSHPEKLLNHTRLFEKLSEELLQKQKKWEEVYLTLEGSK